MKYFVAISSQDFEKNFENAVMKGIIKDCIELRHRGFIVYFRFKSRKCADFASLLFFSIDVCCFTSSRLDVVLN